MSEQAAMWKRIPIAPTLRCLHRSRSYYTVMLVVLWRKCDTSATTISVVFVELGNISGGPRECPADIRYFALFALVRVWGGAVRVTACLPRGLSSIDTPPARLVRGARLSTYVQSWRNTPREYADPNFKAELMFVLYFGPDVKTVHGISCDHTTWAIPCFCFRVSSECLLFILINICTHDSRLLPILAIADLFTAWFSQC